ncbi:MAG TPA: HAMP domain-containing sensor histidine kinase [Streptosporangiaceae bacterium]|jgi:signal transduction histidine kinase|nr:HAMP domain-containing sensor histidine kinase [Streptosporangiaceae bacterium]
MRPGPAARVAAAATGIIAVVYVLAVIVLNLVVSGRLTQQDDARLADRLAAARHDPDIFSEPVVRTFRGSDDADADLDADADSEPVFFWLLNGRQAVTAHSPGAPALPPAPLGGRARRPGGGLAVTADLARQGPFRLEVTPDGGGWLVAGQSLAGVAHTKRLLLYAEVLAGPFLLLAMFFGSLAVGQRALAPVEQSRRRQLEFTADASHELRTPLSVIRAEADVALSTQRDAAGYRDALVRIQGESARLRHLVDDMLWLARFDSRPPPPRDEPVDLATLAQASADRFRAVGPAITAEVTAEPALINAPPEWIDRLAGVLMDNACRHAGPDGRVRIGVRVQGSRVSLTVEDSGPGIPEAERPRLFDRFHRATEDGQGAGLGLAIGDSIVRSTGGRWHVGDSALGGALMMVTWRHSEPHRRPLSRVTAGSS